MKKKLIILICSFIIILGIIFYIMRDNKPKNTTITPPPKIVNNDKTVENKPKLVYNKSNCKIQEESFNVKGNSMVPMLKNGIVIKLKLNYYNCDNNKIKYWDIVVFENPYTGEKIIKIASILPWDKITKDKKNNIKVNWKVLKNSVWEEYKFDELAIRWFDINSNKWIIKENTYFLFWDNIKRSIDSRQNWPISIDWILWKVEL